MKKLLILSDSFKGTMSSAQVGEIVAKECRAVFPACEVRVIPVADGGEGTAECFEAALPAERVPCRVQNPFGEEIDAWYVRKGKLAIVEMAKAAGLPLVQDRLDPLRASTYGVGQLLRHAVEQGCTELVLGLGGSATNDGGCGMAAALGTRFLDEDGQEFVPTGGSLCRIAAMDNTATQTLLAGCTLRAMCDIDHPLCGERGAAAVFAPQKGADEAAVQLLDQGLRHLDTLFAAQLGRSVLQLPGAGAAGGMGGGVVALLGGTLSPGIETVLDLIHFEEQARGADYIITGEGRLDAQSMGGKVVIGVARRAKALGVPVLALAGDLELPLDDIFAQGVTAAFGINQPLMDVEKAKRNAPEMLRYTAKNLFRFLGGMAH